MKKKHLLLLFLLMSAILVACFISKGVKESHMNTNDESLELLKQGYLTKKDALSEFKFLYDYIKESYPHLNAYKRKYEMYGFDPDKRHSHYYTMIKDNYDEKISVQDYYDIVKKYMDEYYFFAHMGIYDPINVQYAYNVQESFLQLGYNNNVALNGVIETLNNERSLILYSQLGVIPETARSKGTYGSDLSFKYFDDYSAAYVNINSFAGVLIECDKEPLLEFYKKIADYDNLIIDISNNGGGTTEYWRDLIVLPNIDKPLTGKFPPMFFMDSEDIKTFVEELGIKYDPISGFDFTQYPNFNKEDIKKLAYVIDTSSGINNYMAGVDIPNKKMFKGEIYILTGDETYSAADQFAFFAKSTDFATLIGTNTRGGTGVLGYPFHLSLPQSGIVIRFDSLYRIDETGKSIDEFGTTPDVLVESDSLALQACLDLIASKR